MESDLNKKEMVKYLAGGVPGARAESQRASLIAIALIELREALEESLDTIAQRIADQTEATIKALKDGREATLNQLAEGRERQVKTIVELQKEVLRLQTQAAGQARQVEMLRQTVRQLSLDVKQPHRQLQDLAIAVETIQEKVK